MADAITIGQHVEWYPMMIGGEIVTKRGPYRHGTVVEIVPAGQVANLVSNHDSLIVERGDGQREMISIRQVVHTNPHLETNDV